MLGRGTRLCPEINKEFFTIFDCLDGSLIEYFKNTTDFKVEPPQKDLISLQQIIENIYQNIDRKYYIKVLVKRLRRIERTMSGEARKQFANFIPDGDIGEFVSELPTKIKNDFTNTMNLLRDEKFRDLLLNYPRAKRTFLVGYGVPDEVESEVMIRRGNKYQKPEDYLDAFAMFIKENREQIEAIQILVKKPKEWKTDVLNELRKKLAQNDFPEKELQKAHRIVHHKDLADIISMIKHAAKEEEPILTAEERVDKALKTTMAEKSFNEEQQNWLGLIREHLITNLTIELDDFKYAPIFERQGGKGKAEKVFKDELESLIAEINCAIAA